MKARVNLGGGFVAASVLFLTVLASACTTVIQSGPGAGVVAQLSLERFLDAAAARDIQAMGRLFGTNKGPIMNTGSTFGCAFKKMGTLFGGSSCVKKRDVEVRLAAIADVLRHDDYRVVREEAVPGRLNEARRIWVDFTVKGQRVADVPFVVVRMGNGQWLVEEVDLQRLMAGARRGNSRAGGR